MTRIPHIPALNPAAVLKQFGLRPEKKLGQNFLHDPQILERITLAAEISPQDTVLEIGPGVGSLTRYLATACDHVVAVELDPDLLDPLKSVLKPYKNIRVVNGDILKFKIPDLIDQADYLVVANIPYHITSAILRHLLEGDPKPRRLVLTLQKEVVKRICSSAGDLSLLALSVQVYGAPRLEAVIPAEAFHPIPKVDSAILRVDVHPQPLIPRDLLGTFFKLIKAGFGQKRKTLRNSLSSGLKIPPGRAEALLRQGAIDPMRRAETLTIDEWHGLCKILDMPATK